MDIKNSMKKTSKSFYSTMEVAAWMGYVGTSMIILIVFVDVLGRYFFNKPLPGAYELVEQIMIVLGGFAIMYATAKRGHVAVDLVISRFSKRTQVIMQRIFSLSGFIASVVLAYYVYLNGLKQLKPFPQTTSVLHIGTTPFTLALATAILLNGLMFLIQTFGAWDSANGEEEESSHE